jgi:hypothetical protein
MNSTKFPSILSRTERALTGAAAVTMSFAVTTTIAAAFQGAAVADEAFTLLAVIVKAFA